MVTFVRPPKLSLQMLGVVTPRFVRDDMIAPRRENPP
jgi:hypothetical protein